MSKPVTVNKLAKQLQKLIDEGHGSVHVLVYTEPGNSPRVKLEDDRKPRYIGPSPHDKKTWVLDRVDGSVAVLL